jgi:hypothetical protein
MIQREVFDAEGASFLYTNRVSVFPAGLSLSGRPKARLQCYVLRSKIEVCRRRTTSALGIPNESTPSESRGKGLKKKFEREWYSKLEQQPVAAECSARPEEFS